MFFTRSARVIIAIDGCVVLSFIIWSRVDDVAEGHSPIFRMKLFNESVFSVTIF
jgi:hypothetical protein